MGLDIPINSSSRVLIGDEFWEFSVGEVPPANRFFVQNSHPSLPPKLFTNVSSDF